MMIHGTLSDHIINNDAFCLVHQLLLHLESRQVVGIVVVIEEVVVAAVDTMTTAPCSLLRAPVRRSQVWSESTGRRAHRSLEEHHKEVHEQVLQFLVREVDAELFEMVHFEVFETEDIKHTFPCLCVSVGACWGVCP